MLPAQTYNIYYSTTPGVTPITGTKIANATSPYVLDGLPYSTTYYYIIETTEFGIANQPPQRCMAEGHAYYLNKHVTGDHRKGRYATGALYFYDQSNYTEAGIPITRTRVTPHISNSLKRIKYVSLQIDYQSGTTTYDPGNPNILATPNPKVESLVGLQYSDDGGKTWSNQRFVSLGFQGEYKKRVIFYRLGMSRNRVFRITDTNNCYTNISGAEITLELGAT